MRFAAAWLLALLLLCCVDAPARAAGLGTLTTFGDSYTQSKWYTVTTWAEQLRRSGAISGLANYAKAGATAGGANNGRATFDGQLDEWQRDGGRLTRRTVVYFGYNDVNRRLDLAASGRTYAAGVDRLIRARANADGRRVLLALIHDWSRNPTGFPSQRARVDTWNRTVRNVARARGLRVVDLFTKINAVFRSPRSFNITNTTTPSRTNLGHLYFDGAHFGVRGQGIIAATVRAALAP